MEQENYSNGCEPRCRGCSHRDWLPLESESQKENWLKSQLNEWVGQIEPVRGVRELRQRWGYRQKACLHAEWKGKHWAFGLLSAKETGNGGLAGQLKRPRREYEVIDISRCPIHSPNLNRVVQRVAEILPPPDRFPLAFLVVSGDLLTFVVKSHLAPELPTFNWESIGLKGVFINRNPCAGNRIFWSKGWSLIWGHPYAERGALKYGPDSFQQLIPELHDDSLREAEEFLDPKAGDAVLDFCSGVGQSLALWKKRGCDFIGVELNGEASRYAELNVGEGSCLRGRVSERLPQLEEWLARKKARRVQLYANPSRLGLESEVTNWICTKARPERFAYLSCSAGTLARDLSAFCESGYTVRKVIPYDFFPQTHHLETLVLLSHP